MRNYPGYNQPPPPSQQSYPPPPGGIPNGGYGGNQFQAVPKPPGGPPGPAFYGRPAPPAMSGPPPPAVGMGPPNSQGNLGFRSPPPPQNGSVPGLQNAMGGMSIGQRGSVVPPPPTINQGGATFQAPQQPTMFRPPNAPQMSAPPQMMQPPPGPNGSSQMGSSFYQQGAPPEKGQMNGMPVTNANSLNPAMDQQQAGMQENVDLNIKIPKRLFRLSSTHIPQSASMTNSLKIPVGAVLRPLAPPGPDEEDVDVVNPGAAGIIRCKRCRLYINPFVAWFENGRRWRCNICGQVNECPSAYFCHLDAQNQRRDRLQRPELSKSVVEFIAPSEYMVRPPQPSSYFFVIDVSATAVRSGVLASMANAIKRSLDDLPGETRTQVGFITFDNSVQYYSLKAGLTNPQMMVVADLKELFVPAPDDLLVNLKDSREVVEGFLDSLPTMFAHNQATEACLGPALKAAFTVMKNIGGKMNVFLSTLPTLGDGALKPRENFRMMGTPEETKLLKPESTWYKETGVELCRAQISVDMYLFPFQYIDAASLSQLCKNTAGTLNTYPMFDAASDGPRFEGDLSRKLTQNTAFEAVMRVRCTKGMRITNFHGNYYIRGTDLLALPNCNSDSVFGFHITHDDQNVPTNIVTIQSALLYTSSTGQRRIRVLTQAVPVTSLTTEFIEGVDVDTSCNLIAKQALEVALKSNLDTARTRLHQTCMDIVRGVKKGDQRQMSGYSAGPPPPQGGQGGDDKPLPENLKLLPLNCMALIKNIVFRGGTDIHPDERVQAMHRLNTISVHDGRSFIYPKMFSIHDMDALAGKMLNTDTTEDEDSASVAGRNKVVLPKVVNLTVDRLASNGIFLLDNGVDMYMWVGRSVDPAVMSSLFGMETLEGIDETQVKLRESGSDHASRLHTIVSALRDEKNTVAKVNIVREGDDAKEQRFFWYLVEDRASFQGGTYNYSEFVQMVTKQGAPGGGPPGMGAPPAPRQQPGRYGQPPAPGGPPPPHIPPPAPPSGLSGSIMARGGMPPPIRGGPPRPPYSAPPPSNSHPPAPHHGPPKPGQIIGSAPATTNTPYNNMPPGPPPPRMPQTNMPPSHRMPPPPPQPAVNRSSGFAPPPPPPPNMMKRGRMPSNQYATR